MRAGTPNSKKLASLARDFESRGQLERAERLYRRALAADGSGAADLDNAALLNNLGALYQHRGEANRAERMYLRALRIKDLVLGPDSEQVAVTLNNLAVFYKMAGRFADARQCYERALGIFERAFGAMDSNVAAVLSNLAQLMRAEAESLDRRTAQIEQCLKETEDGKQLRNAVIDQRRARFRLAVRPSRIHRFGVFAEESIPAGCDIIEYTGQRVGRREAVRRWNRNRTYLLKLDAYWRLDGAANGSGAQFINHCCEPNVRFRVDGGAVWCSAIQDIAAGEELTLDYKFPRDAERIPCYCGAPRCRGTINETLAAKPVASFRSLATPCSVADASRASNQKK